MLVVRFANDEFDRPLAAKPTRFSHCLEYFDEEQSSTPTPEIPGSPTND